MHATRGSKGVEGGGHAEKAREKKEAPWGLDGAILGAVVSGDGTSRGIAVVVGKTEAAR